MREGQSFIALHSLCCTLLHLHHPLTYLTSWWNNHITCLATIDQPGKTQAALLHPSLGHTLAPAILPPQLQRR